MNSATFRSLFEDMTAGWVDWMRSSDGVSVVSCAVWSPTPGHGEDAWLAAAGVSRHASARALKAFGVHGLKFKTRPSGLTPSSIIEVARANLGSIVSLLPDGDLVIFS